MQSVLHCVKDATLHCKLLTVSFRFAGLANLPLLQSSLRLSLGLLLWRVDYERSYVALEPRRMCP